MVMPKATDPDPDLPLPSDMSLTAASSAATLTSPAPPFFQEDPRRKASTDISPFKYFGLRFCVRSPAQEADPDPAQYLDPASARKAPCQLTNLSRTLLTQPRQPGAPAKLSLVLQSLRRAQRRAPAELALALLCRSNCKTRGPDRFRLMTIPELSEGWSLTGKKSAGQTSLTGLEPQGVQI
jgi:hypothetical protein